MVLSLFHSIDFMFVDLNIKNKIIFQMKTEHGSVYIMTEYDDSMWKHAAKFAGEQWKLLRLCIAHRCLGRRQKAHCADYKGEERLKEVHLNPNQDVKKYFPDDVKGQEIFGHKRG